MKEGEKQSAMVVRRGVPSHSLQIRGFIHTIRRAHFCVIL